MKKTASFIMSLLLCLSCHATALNTSDHVMFGRRDGVNTFAIFTFCTCDNRMCHLYDFTNKLKDLYCQQHGCDHIIKTNYGKPIQRESEAHALFVAAFLEVLEDSNYEFVFLTGTDQIIVNLNIPPIQWIPKTCRTSQYDIFQSIDKYFGYSGVCSGGLFRNTPYTRQFVREYRDAMTRGSYVMGDQSPYNVLLLRRLITNNDSRTIKYFRSFERGGSCEIFLPDEYYKFKKEHFKNWEQRLKNSINCFIRGFHEYYFNNTLTGKHTMDALDHNSVGRLSSPICLFSSDYRRKDHSSGENWNFSGFLGAVKYNIFMTHLAGKKNATHMHDHFDTIRKRLPRRLQDKLSRANTSVYEICVRPFEK